MQVIEEPADLAALRPEWEALHSRTFRPRMTQSFDWAWCVWEQMAEPTGAKLFCITIRSGGRLVLVWPFMIQRHHRFWRVATPLATDSDYSEVLVEPGPCAVELIRAAWGELLRRRPAPLVQLLRLRGDSVVKEALARERPQVLGAQPVTMTSWEGAGSFEEFWKARPKSFRQSHERRKRRLAEQGEVAYDTVEDPESLRRLFAWILRHKADWAERKNISAGIWLRSSDYHRFFDRACSSVRSCGRLVGSVLSLNGEPIAVQIGRLDPWRMEALHCAYDAAYSKLCPGLLMTEKLLEWAFERGLEVDFMYGDQAFKQIFSNRETGMEELSFACAPWGHAHHRLRDLHWELAALKARLRPRPASMEPEAPAGVAAL